ncbi:MAG TPA: antitoxin MazE family protein [Stellaceae bacterium]|nr:antitoxin MazE family protein [Stellaceae bacterium]
MRQVTCNLSRRVYAIRSSIVGSRARVKRHRDRLRAQGLRPIQIWVPDVTTRHFRAEAHRQSLAVSKSPHAVDDQAFIDAISVGFDE